MTDTTITPTTVDIEWSEAGGILAAGATLPFDQFEAAALEAALGHPGGSYLKTKVRVHFDSGDTYECRLDLGDNERGFADGIQRRIKYHESAEGKRRRAEWHGEMRERHEELYALWIRMRVGPDLTWCRWEIEDLRNPVDRTFCTLTTRH
ncbi:hypothetical protein JQX09_17830 [Sulfitobacter pseudonitzschiae]|uniref:Large polyvalent protein associated domain-containing protein n=1 Tax=Pseudosulfitobacter pseudonitzschiae TaxID=1402135 RepID=A0A9Q2P4P5_9RHOB|nr:LPD25 domain-containing protein [Pseudosulfitobacter pseudonitzschiae]MBM2293791.1 hypothetical protein [Pseudosulfitobacter pseudonitzschiae]MBM2298709.1 hypothetical protein [Pseudosulfitobacter pseudonitzschiae]MBM2303623.1 hypothetical protein [Pseudosulfitobacter pseudonitzschiae]MBM2313406.1 hypothetical protein [Pseudosulfitobacter pseudonitzschiae]MBM2318319.1 hypothetical protein [Pseudosulfitobacter pseudonitzschiae]